MEDILKRGFAQPNILPETNPMLISNFESIKISYRGRILQYHIWAGCMSDLYDEMTHILGDLSSPVLSAVGERYYKVTAEALRVCGELVRVVRPGIEVSSSSTLNVEL
ncbi:Cullin-associated NEDD8-dissociated protein 1, partial [Cucurbita argyrosperma subsp. argyrosperma]